MKSVTKFLKILKVNVQEELDIIHKRKFDFNNYNKK